MQISHEAEVSSTQRREKLSEFSSHIQTLTSEASETGEMVKGAVGEAREGLKQLGEGSKKASEECSSVLSQTQTAMEEGVGGLEKV